MSSLESAATKRPLSRIDCSSGASIWEPSGPFASLFTYSPDTVSNVCYNVITTHACGEGASIALHTQHVAVYEAAGTHQLSGHHALTQRGVNSNQTGSRWIVAILS